jgi:VWFA-related protein
MKRFLLTSLAALFLVGTLLPQDTAKVDVTPTIRANTRMVAVDVLVTDAAGKPVTDLKPEDIVVEENGKTQKIASMELMNSAAEAPDVLPDTIYSNRPEFTAPRGSYTILLIDALNTPVQNASYARQQLLSYAASQTQAGQRIAVYALGNGLYKLQGFTDDAQLLQDAIQRSEKVANAGATATPDSGRTLPVPGANSTSGTPPGGNNSLATSLVSRLTAFSTEGIAYYNVQMQIERTTAALRALARMMLGIPGRKNLVWVTAGVPITLNIDEMAVTTVREERTDPTAQAPLNSESSYAAYEQNIRQEAANPLKEVSSLLQRAQISVYPVDARGLFGAGATSQTQASSSGVNSQGMLVMGAEYGRAVSASGSAISNSQANMRTIASETGGRYFVNRNDIDRAVAVAADDGRTYYLVSYYPEKKKFDGTFRKIKVNVKRPGLTVRNRSGYYAVDFSKGSKKDRETDIASALNMASSAPSTMLLFDARIVPPAPAAKATVPVLFRVPAGNFTAEDGKDNGKHLSLDFFVTAATGDGKVVNTTGKTVDTTVTAEQFQQIEKQGLLLPIDMELPPGNYNLQLGVRDNPTGMVGTLNAPLRLAKP